MNQFLNYSVHPKGWADAVLGIRNGWGGGIPSIESKTLTSKYVCPIFCLMFLPILP